MASGPHPPPLEEEEEEARPEDAADMRISSTEGSWSCRFSSSRKSSLFLHCVSSAERRFRAGVGDSIVENNEVLVVLLVLALRLSLLLGTTEQHNEVRAA